MKLGNLFVNKDGNLKVPKEEQKVEDVTEQNEASPEIKSYKKDFEKEDLPEEFYRISIFYNDRDIVYDVQGKEDLNEELKYLEKSFIDSNIILISVPQHVLVKDFIKGWSFGRFPELND